jgi:glutamine amidotransferase
MPASQKMVISDLGMGNLNSVCRALKLIGEDVCVSFSAKDISQADKIILPGVGHFGRAMEELRLRGLENPLNEAVLEKRKPVLGICLGMELMSKWGEEGYADGLGWLNAETVKFQFNDKKRFRIPHMGWNTISIMNNSELLNGIDELDEFYFAHAYYVRPDKRALIAAETTYETTFASVVERDNIFGVQFHPEKSHAAGLKILRNFADI